MKRLSKIVIILLLALLLMRLSGVFHRPAIDGAARLEAGSWPAPTAVATVKAERLPQYWRAVGRVETAAGVKLAAETAGRIEEVLVDVGDRVHSGQVLLRLDRRDPELRVAQAQSQRQAAKARAQEAQAAAARTAALFAKEAATQEQLERAQAADAQAKASVAAAEQQLAQAKLLLSYGEVQAPTDGLIQERLVDPGDLAAPGQPLFLIQDRGPLEFHAQVLNRLVNGLQPGQVLTLELDDREQVLPVTLREIQPAVDPQAGTVRVSFTLPAESDARPGTFGRVGIPNGEQTRLTIPTAAIIHVGQLHMVLCRLEDGRWQRRLVQLGHELDHGRQVLLSGLHAGDTIGWHEAAGPASEKHPR